MAKCFLAIYICLYLATPTILLTGNAAGEANKVSPKLDFNSYEYKNNSDVPIVIGKGRDKTDDKQIVNAVSNDTSDNNDRNLSKDTKSSPKIHAVRVTVDTGNAETSKEAKESIEITGGGSQKKRIGIHTDITFEISTDDAGTNATITEQDDVKDDASVPVYKGSNNGFASHSRRTYDSKSQWNPNFSAERRSVDGTSRFIPVYYYPEYYLNNVPIQTEFGYNRAAGSVNRRSDNWNTNIPNMWTTERTYTLNGQTITAHRASNSGREPCYCATGFVSNNKRGSRGDPSKLHPFGILASKTVNGKLESPFSNK